MGAPPGPTGSRLMVQSSLILDWFPLVWVLYNPFGIDGEQIEPMKLGVLDLPFRLLMADRIVGSRSNRDL